MLLCLTIPCHTWANTTRILRIELSYSGSAVSYNLYKDGVRVCSNMNTDESQIDCPVEIDPTPMTFIITAVDQNGTESPQSAPYILVPPELPTASFTSTIISKTEPALVSFDASDSVDFDGMIIRYDWDFGDGSTGAGKFIDHPYPTPGTYTTRLTVIDDDSHSAEMTSLLTIAPAPVAISQSLTTRENCTLRGILTAENSPEETTLTFTLETTPQHGIIKEFDTRTGGFAYTPHPDFNGADHFTFTASNETMNSSQATVSVTVTPANNAPTTVTDFGKVNTRRSIVIPVATNDSDLDGDLLTVVSVTPPSSGKAQIINNSICYTAPNTAGLVIFWYQISDDKGKISLGTVEVAVSN